MKIIDFEYKTFIYIDIQPSLYYISISYVHIDFLYNVFESLNNCKYSQSSNAILYIFNKFLKINKNYHIGEFNITSNTFGYLIWTMMMPRIYFFHWRTNFF